MSKVKSTVDYPMSSSPVGILTNKLQWTMSRYKEYILGRILTLADGCIADAEQRKAVKDLMKEIIWSREYYTEDLNKISFFFAEKYAKNLLEQLNDFERKDYESFKNCPVNSEIIF